MAGRNAAQRVLALITRMDETPNGGQASMLDGLKFVFDYEPMDAEREHARRLEAWRAQLDMVRRHLHRMGFPDALYMRWLNMLDNALRPTALAHPFEHLRQHANESVRLCLAWCAYALEDEGGADEAEAAEELAKQLRELLASEALNALPESVQHIYATHLQAVLDALDLARIDGSQSLRKAAKAAAMDIVAHQDEILDVAATATDASKGFVQKAGSALGKAFDLAKKGGEAADGIEKIAKLVVTHGPKAAELLGWAADRLP